jgi:hypothetical protein
MGWSQQNIITNVVIIEGPDDGLFVYDGTPAAGNLVASIASVAGTDEFGNVYLDGLAAYNPSLTGPVPFAFLRGETLGIEVLTAYNDVTITGTPVSFSEISSQIYGSYYIGPTGDVTGSDDAFNIQARITAGDPVTTGPGAFYTDAELTLASHLVLAGGGADQTVINQVPANTDGLYGNQLTHVTIRDLTLAGPGDTAGTGDAIHLDSLSSSPNTNIEISNVHLNDWGDQGVYLNTPVMASLRGVEAQNCAENGFHILNGTSTTLTSCYANNVSNVGHFIDNMQYSSWQACAADFGNIGYLIQGSNGITLSSCGCEAQNTGQGPGFKIDGASTAITLTGCVCRANPGIACWVTGNSEVTITDFREVAPAAGATASIQVDAGSTAVIINPQYVTAPVYNGDVIEVRDGITSVWSGGVLIGQNAGSIEADIPAAAINAGSFQTLASAGVIAGQQYKVAGYLFYANSVAAAQPEYQLAGPATSQCDYTLRNASITAGTATITQGIETALSVAFGGGSANTASQCFEWFGTMTFSAAGTLELQGAESTPGDTVSVLRGLFTLTPMVT